MPKYELMYILSSAVSDNDTPAISSEIDKFIKDADGTVLSQEMLGKKKLAYPIKKTRNGFYVLLSFTLDGSKVAALDNKLRSIESIIRYIIVNTEELLLRKAKDQERAEKMRATRKPKRVPSAPVVTVPEIQLTETELEKKIEEALGSQDLTK